MIESFHATLEEINSATYILNVIDVNDINVQSKIQTTKQILKDTGVSNEKISNMINVYNKIDMSKSKFNFNTKNLQRNFFFYTKKFLSQNFSDPKYFFNQTNFLSTHPKYFSNQLNFLTKRICLF